MDEEHRAKGNSCALVGGRVEESVKWMLCCMAWCGSTGVIGGENVGRRWNKWIKPVEIRDMDVNG